VLTVANMIVGIVGVPGIGKTTLMQHVAERLRDGVFWYEEPEDYPLVNHVAGRNPHWHLLNQVSFQIHKIEYAASVGDGGTCDYVIEADWVSSHHLWRDGLMAAGLLTPGGERALDGIYNAALAAPVPVPGLYVQIAGTLETALARLTVRGRQFELNDNLSHLLEALTNVDLSTRLSPLLKVSSDIQPAEAADLVCRALRKNQR
jgi:deoxyadenosine/deoxycytidine kinase